MMARTGIRRRIRSPAPYACAPFDPVVGQRSSLLPARSAESMPGALRGGLETEHATLRRLLPRHAVDAFEDADQLLPNVGRKRRLEQRCDVLFEMARVAGAAQHDVDARLGSTEAVGRVRDG